MGYWNRKFGPTFLGVSKKKANGVTVGYALGFVREDGTWIRNVRADTVFKDKDSALAAMQAIDKARQTVNYIYKSVAVGEPLKN